VAALVFVSSLLLGNWFNREAKRIKAEGKPLYLAYLTPPGIIIVISILLIIVFYYFFAS